MIIRGYRVSFNEKILESFLRELMGNENLSDRTIQQYYDGILDFDAYLCFIFRTWDNALDDDYDLFMKLLKRIGLTDRGIWLRVSHVKRFKEYYDTNKFKKKFV